MSNYEFSQNQITKIFQIDIQIYDMMRIYRFNFE